MPFDIEAAKKAGYSDDEINQYLANKPKTFDVTADQFDVEAAIKAGYTEKEVADHLASKNIGQVKPEPKKEQPPTDWRKIGTQAARTFTEGGGLIGGGAIGGLLGLGGGPVGSAAGAIAGGGLGYGIGKKTADIIEELFGVRKTPALGEQLKETGKDVATGLSMAGYGEGLGLAIPQALKTSGSLISSVWGRLTNKGKLAIDEAYRNSPSFQRAVTGKITGEEIAENAKDALQGMREQRALAYQDKLAEISGISPQGAAIPGQPSPQMQSIDMTPIRDKVVELMRRYRVKIDPTTRKMDTSRVAMGKSGANDIEDMLDNVMQWGSKQGDDTALGLDTLKRQLDDFYSESSQARQFVTALRKTVDETISQAVPTYKEMTKGYAEATSLIKDLESGLMLKKSGINGRVTSDNILRRLLSSLKENFEMRGDLLKTLSNESGQDILGEVAGYAMKDVAPSVFSTSGAFLLGESALIYLNPKLLPIVAASSPRLASRFLRTYGDMMRTMQGSSSLASQAMSYAGQKDYNKKQYFTVTPNPFLSGE